MSTLEDEQTDTAALQAYRSLTTRVGGSQPASLTPQTRQLLDMLCVHECVGQPTQTAERGSPGQASCI